MPLRDAFFAPFGSPVGLMLLGGTAVLGLLRGLWKGLLKRKRSGADYFISLLIYMVTDAFLFLLLGVMGCVLLQYLPALLGLDTGLLEVIP